MKLTDSIRIYFQINIFSINLGDTIIILSNNNINNCKNLISRQLWFLFPSLLEHLGNNWCKDILIILTAFL